MLEVLFWALVILFAGLLQAEQWQKREASSKRRRGDR